MKSPWRSERLRRAAFGIAFLQRGMVDNILCWPECCDGFSRSMND
jgi:hypothetical protein